MGGRGGGGGGAGIHVLNMLYYLFSYLFQPLEHSKI